MNKKFSFAVAKTGATGSTGVGVKSITPYYLASSKNTDITNATTGFSTTMQTTTTTNKYLWSYQLITYTNNTTAKTTAVIISTHGATGATGGTGADAIRLTISSSAGTVFKNNNSSATLTAHVWKGAVEQSITDAGVCGSLGSVKWYKGDATTTSIATAKSITVTADDVLDAQQYTCQLE